MSAPDFAEIARALIASGESFHVEFKSAQVVTPEGVQPRDLKAIAKDIGDTLVAFANADGGDLLVGVEDNGVVTGLHFPRDHQVLYLVNAPKDQVLGGLGARVNNVLIDGQLVLWFRVDARNEIAVTSDGRCLRRRGTDNKPQSPTEIERLRLHVAGEEYESQPVSLAKVEDLDLGSVFNAPSAHPTRPEYLPGSTSDPVPTLRYWNLIEQRNGLVILRRAALLLFARDPYRWHPNLRIRLRTVVGEEGWGESLNTQEVEVGGPIVRQLHEAERLVLGRLVRSTLQGSLFQSVPILPEEAVRECLVNAVVHRNYAIQGQAIEVLFYSDRVEFRSPGQPPEGISLRDLKAGRRVHRARNPLVMRVLRDLGWTRDEGEGMRRIFGSMRQVELHVPDLIVEGDTLVVRLSTQSVYDEETLSWLASYGRWGLRAGERKVLVALRQAGGELSVDKLANQLNIGYDSAKALVSGLEERGFTWHYPRSRSYHLVGPGDVPFHRFGNLIWSHDLEATSALQIDLSLAQRLSEKKTPQATLRWVEEWVAVGILVPAGSHRWRLGDAVLKYLQQWSDTP